MSDSSGDDSSDEDFIPDEHARVESECSEAEAVSSGDEIDESTCSQKRKKVANVSARKKVKSTVQNAAETVPNDSDSQTDKKARVDLLWADFLSSTDNTDTRTSVKSDNSKHASTEGVSNTNTETTTKINSDMNTRNGGTTSKIDSIFDEVESNSFTHAHASVADTKPHVPLTQATQAGTTKVPFATNVPAPLARGTPKGGLSSILSQIGKKDKLSTLEKSKLDWDQFKEKEGIKEELQTFNKGKDGYLERQDFLQRTDLRQFEREKQLRMATRRK